MVRQEITVQNMLLKMYDLCNTSVINISSPFQTIYNTLKLTFTFINLICNKYLYFVFIFDE